MALCGEARALFAVESFEFEVAIVQGVRKMRCRAAGLASADASVFEQNH